MFDALEKPAGQIWLEPAAGTGAFVQALAEAGAARIVALDIDPKAPGIERADFLTSSSDVQQGICLTNPPFGRNHALSVPFFNAAARCCDVVAFIVPRSWRKWSIVNRLDKRFHKVLDVDIDLRYVDAEGVPLAVSSVLRTVFQIWERRDEERPPPPPAPARLERTTPETANAALTVFGHGCGTLRRHFPRKANTTQLFLRASSEDLDTLAEIDLRGFFNNVAYTEALSIREVNFALETCRRTGRTRFSEADVASLTLADEARLVDTATFVTAYAPPADSVCVWAPLPAR